MSPPVRSRGTRTDTGTQVVQGFPGSHPKKVRPYAWPQLQRVSRRQARLLDRLDWLLPASLLAGELPDAARTRMRELFDGDVRVWLDFAQVIPADRLRKVIVDPTFLAVVGAPARTSRGVLEFELGLAREAINLLLGATGADAIAARALTDIEEGVVAYVLLEALKALTSSFDPERTRFRLDRILHSANEAVELFRDESEVAITQFKMTIGIHAGFFRVFLPSSVLAHAVPAPDSGERIARQLGRFAHHTRRLSALKIDLRAEIARAEISTGDFASLHPGDVLLVDDVTARPDRNEGGRARLRLGLGRAGYLDASISLEGGRYRATIDAIRAGEDTPAARETSITSEVPVHELPGAVPGGQPARPQTGGDDRTTVIPTTKMEDVVSEPANPSAAPLLNDVPMQIAVELGRMPVTAEQVVGLHVGQIIELNKAPGEAVDLSVHGRIVARGELVEVEGQIGVRILTISG